MDESTHPVPLHNSFANFLPYLVCFFADARRTQGAQAAQATQGKNESLEEF